MKSSPAAKNILKKRDITSLVKPIIKASEEKTQKKIDVVGESVLGLKTMVKEMAGNVSKLMPKPAKKFDPNLIKVDGEAYRYNEEQGMFRTESGKFVAREKQGELKEKLEKRNARRAAKIKKDSYAKVDFSPVIKMIESTNQRLEKIKVKDEKQKKRIDSKFQDVVYYLKELKKQAKSTDKAIEKLSKKKKLKPQTSENRLPEMEGGVEPKEPKVRKEKPLSETARTKIIDNALMNVVKENFSPEDAKKFEENYDVYKDQYPVPEVKPGIGVLVTFLTGNEKLGRAIDTAPEKTRKEIQADRKKAEEQLYTIIAKYQPDLVSEITTGVEQKEKETRERTQRAAPESPISPDKQEQPESPLNVGPLDALGINTDDPLDDDERVRILSEVMTVALIKAFQDNEVKTMLTDALREAGNNEGGGIGSTLIDMLGGGKGKNTKGGIFGRKGAFTRRGAKVVGKSLLKKIPIIGLLAGLGFGAYKLMEGDAVGAGLEVASGAASTVPGIGTAASVAIDVANESRDVSGDTDTTTLQDNSANQIKMQDLTPVPAMSGDANRIKTESTETPRGTTSIEQTEQVVVQTEKPIQQTVVVNNNNSNMAPPIREFPLTPRNYESSYSRMIAEDFTHPAISTSGSF